jgi:hypothetical protein
MQHEPWGHHRRRVSEESYIDAGTQIHLSSRLGHRWILVYDENKDRTLTDLIFTSVVARLMVTQKTQEFLDRFRPSEG